MYLELVAKNRDLHLDFDVPVNHLDNYLSQVEEGSLELETTLPSINMKILQRGRNISLPIWLHGEGGEGSGHSHINLSVLNRILAFLGSTDSEVQDLDTAVASLLKIRNEHLRKDVADTAAEKITFENGIEAYNASRFHGYVTFKDIFFGEYIAGILAGAGGKIDSGGNAELESLIIRRFLEVPELRYNRVVIDNGNRWAAPGGGLIETVDTGTRIATLKLEDGEIGTIAVGDLCMGIFHSTVSNDNSSSDSDDNQGDFRFAGFYTAYFRVTEILEAGRNSRFRYVLRGTDAAYPRQFSPCAAMTFVAYGNVENTARQQSVYSTRTYTRYLKGVSTWKFGVNNIAMQFGDCSGLASAFSSLSNVAGYSAYLSNIYLSGTIKELDAIAPYMQISEDKGGFLAVNESTNVVCKIFNGYNQDITSDFTNWSIQRESGDDASDQVWNAAHLNVGSSFALSFTDLGTITAEYRSTLFTIIASDGSAEGTVEETYTIGI